MSSERQQFVKYVTFSKHYPSVSYYTTQKESGIFLYFLLYLHQ